MKHKNKGEIVDLKNTDRDLLEKPNQTKLVGFIISLVLFFAYFIFTFIMFKVNKVYLDSYSDSMNFFRIVSWAMSGRFGFYFVFSWLFSIVLTASFSLAANSTNTLISLISKILTAFSLLTLFLPILVLFILI